MVPDVVSARLVLVDIFFAVNRQTQDQFCVLCQRRIFEPDLLAKLSLQPPHQNLDVLCHTIAFNPIVESSGVAKCAISNDIVLMTVHIQIQAIISAPYRFPADLLQCPTYHNRLITQGSDIMASQSQKKQSYQQSRLPTQR